MEVVHARCAGLDVHKRMVVACVVRSGEAGAVDEETRTFGAMTADLEELATWLAAEGCRQVVMEATGVYWKPVYNVLETHGGFTLLVVNPEHVKAVTGRKTDRQDARRLALLLRHDLLQGSYIPDRDQRELREMTRTRTTLVRERARVVQRLEKTLEAGNIKLGAVLTELLERRGRRCCTR
jgi:transposase